MERGITPQINIFSYFPPITLTFLAYCKASCINIAVHSVLCYIPRQSTMYKSVHILHYTPDICVYLDLEAFFEPYW